MESRTGQQEYVREPNLNQYLKKLPSKIRHLLKIKRKLVKDISKTQNNDPNKKDMIDEMKQLDDIINKQTDETIQHVTNSMQ